MTADVALRARFQQQALLPELAGEIADAAGAQCGDRHVGLAVGEIDHGKARGDLGTRGAFEAMIDLVLQELRGLVEQIDRGETVREPADQLVAAAADRRQLAELVEHAERFDRRQVVTFRSEEDLREQLGGEVLRLPGGFRVRLKPRRGARRGERVAVATALGIHLRQHLQRLDLDRVAAPGHGQGLELAQRVVLADLVAPLPQRDLELLGLRRRRPVGRGGCEPVVVERVLVVAERLGEPAAQHGEAGPCLGRDADHFELAAALGGAGIVLHLEGRAHRIHRHDALDVERQRGDGEFDVLELLARVRPFALAREGERLPELGIMAVADHGVGEVLQALRRAADQDAGDRMNDQRAALLLVERIGQHDVGDGLGLVIHRARHVELREVEPRQRAQRRLDRRDRRHQLVLARHEVFRLALAPGFGAEHRAHRGRRPLGRDVDWRQRQSALLAEDHLVGADLDADLVGVRPDRDAVRGFQQREIDEVLPLDEAAHRPLPGDDIEHVAGIGVGELVQLARVGEGDRDVCKRGVGDVARHHQRQRRRLDLVGQREEPVGFLADLLARQRVDQRAGETDAHRLPLVEGDATDLADHRAALGADRLDVDRLRRIEHQPDGIAAAERGRGRCDLNRERHAQAVAVATRIDAGDRGLRRRLDNFLGSFLGSFFGGFLDRLLRGLFGRRELGRHGRSFGSRGRRLRNFLRGLLGRLWSARRLGRGSRHRFRRFGCRHRRRRFRLQLGLDVRLDVDLGFARDRLGGRRHDLALGILRLLGRGLVGRRPRSGTSGLHLCERRLGRRGTLALVGLERHVDDVVLLVAERMHVGIADQRDLDVGLVDVGLLLDRGNVWRRRDDRVRQVEVEVGIESQRELLLVEHGGDADTVGHLEHEAHEGRLHRGTHADRRTLPGLGRGALGAQRALGDARTLGEFLDDVHRQARRRPLPALGQEVDEGALAGVHGVDRDAPRQRQADGGAIGIAARGIDVIGGAFRHAVDGNLDRPVEADDEDRARGRHLGGNVLAELDYEAGKAAAGRKSRLAPDRIGRPARCTETDQQTDRQHARRADTTRQARRESAGSRHKSSGSLSRHWRHFFRFDGRRRS